MDKDFQSGKTQAIDLDELKVSSSNRPREARVRGEFELDKWGDDPWSSTEDGRKRRRWAEDDAWAGDDEEQKADDYWEVDEAALKDGWAAPKRGDVLEATEGWDDWNHFGGGPKQLDQESELKDFGGYRRAQAAQNYATSDASNYGDGRAKRQDIYQEKEIYGSAGLKERRADYYANRNAAHENADFSAEPGFPQGNHPPTGSEPAMVPIDEWDGSIRPVQNNADVGDDMRASARISDHSSAGDDIPGVTRASIIIFQLETEPVVYELKKLVTTVGRGLDNIVIINDQFTSREHLSINYVGGKFELIALSDDNLTSVNGYPISHIVLRNEDQIELGATRIKFVVGMISEEHLTLLPPKNGVPYNIEEPPVLPRSAKATRRSLIILISAVAIIVIALAVSLIIMVVSSRSNDAPTISNDPKQAVFERIADNESAVPSQGNADSVVLSDDERAIAEGILEAIGAGIGQNRSSTSTFDGVVVKIKIESEPSGARIYNADGSLRGLTPYVQSERILDAQLENLLIRKDGFKETQLTLNLDQDKRKFDAFLTLEADVVAPPPKPAPKPKPSAKPKAPPKPRTPTKPKSGSPPQRRLIL